MQAAGFLIIVNIQTISCICTVFTSAYTVCICWMLLQALASTWAKPLVHSADLPTEQVLYVWTCCDQSSQAAGACAFLLLDGQQTSQLALQKRTEKFGQLTVCCSPQP